MADPLVFAKYQALGNDFIIVDARAEPGLVDNEALARGLLDRHRGIGGDDLIFLTKSKRADVRMRIRTPSGGWLSMCGNGIRCLAGYVSDERLHAPDPLRIETDVGVRETRLLSGPERSIEVDLLTPDLRAASIPTTLAAPADAVLEQPIDLGVPGVHNVTCVNVGNPHAIIFVDAVEVARIDRLGPAVEHHPAFPDGVNVHVAQVLATDHARIATWERGAGMTLA